MPRRSKQAYKAAIEYADSVVPKASILQDRGQCRGAEAIRVFSEWLAVFREALERFSKEPEAPGGGGDL